MGFYGTYAKLGWHRSVIHFQVLLTDILGVTFFFQVLLTDILGVTPKCVFLKPRFQLQHLMKNIPYSACINELFQKFSFLRCVSHKFNDKLTFKMCAAHLVLYMLTYLLWVGEKTLGLRDLNHNYY